VIRELEAIWRSVRRVNVFPFQQFRHLRSRHRAALCDPVGLRRLLTTELRMARLEEARVPVHVTATNVLSGEEVPLSRGDALSAVLASAAIPAVFPPVEIDGTLFYDGGVADNASISSRRRWPWAPPASSCCQRATPARSMNPPATPGRCLAGRPRPWRVVCRSRRRGGWASCAG